MVCEAHLVTKVKGWVVDSACTRHIGAFKEEFSSYTPMTEGIECVYVGDNRSVSVSGKGKVLLKLTSGKTLSLNNVIHVPHFHHNLISVHLLGKASIKILFDASCKHKSSQLQKIKQLKRNMVCKYKFLLMYNEYNLYFNSFTKEYPLILSSLNLT